MNQTFLDYNRCPESFANFTLTGMLSRDSGFFLFGEDILCDGSSSSGVRADEVGPDLYDVLADVAIDGAPRLPFDPTEITENLRRERYLRNSHGGGSSTLLEAAARHVYYFLRPAMPVALRRHLQRLRLRGWEKLPFPNWPVDRTVDDILEGLFVLTLKAHAVERIPFIWFWPEGAPSCAILTHDVETLAGSRFCSRLMDLDDSVGIKSSFQIVPEGRYPVPTSFLDSIRQRGFEINVHDVNHGGDLFGNREVFFRHAPRMV